MRFSPTLATILVSLLFIPTLASADKCKPAELAKVCASITAEAKAGIFVKSEASNHISNGDPRAKGYTAICGRQCFAKSPANFYYCDGKKAGSVGYYGIFSGNGKGRYYAAVGGAPAHSAAKIGAQAKRLGKEMLYFQISATKSGGSTKCVEVASKGRSGSYN